MEEILEEIRELREIIQSLQPSQPPESPCQGVTGKGTQCRNRASPGSCYCRMHMGERRVAPKTPKVQKVQKKMKKVQPEHTCGEGGGMCMLCETHGDVWDATLVDAEFERDDFI
jgi:hypothetical protein